MVYMDFKDSPQVVFQDAERDYFGEGYLRKRTWFDAAFHRRRARERIRAIRRHKRNGRLLDVGCGPGDLLVEARRAGFEPLGLEYSPALAAHARDRGGLEVYEGDVATLRSDAPFDVVVMSHVVEHVVSPIDTLREVRRLLTGNGVLYVATPNICSWEARFPGWGSYEPYHLSYFAPSTLTLALREAGFRVRELWTTEPFSAWLNTGLRGFLGHRYEQARLAMQRDVRGVRRPRAFVASTALNAARFVSGAMLTPIRRVQAARLRGEELVCIGAIA